MEENKQDLKTKQPCCELAKRLLHPDVLKWIITGLAGFIIIVLVFGAGVWVGGEKARFSYYWAESYHKNFGGPRPGFLGDWQNFPAGDFIEGYGAFGEIIKIDDSMLVVKGRDNVEKIILIKDNTTIERFRDTIKITDLKIGEYIVVIGEPNNAGQIEAKFIRLLPVLPKETSFRPLPPHMR